MTAQILFCKNDCHRYSSDDMQSDLRAAFKIFDRDRDGFICIEEFKRVGGVWMIIHSFSFHLYLGVQQGKETLKDYLSIFLCRCPRYWAQTCGAKKLRSWWIKLTWWALKKNNFASISRSVPAFPFFTLTFFSLVQAWLFIHSDVIVHFHFLFLYHCDVLCSGWKRLAWLWGVCAHVDWFVKLIMEIFYQIYISKATISTKNLENRISFSLSGIS